jgi:hypothetical protein
MTQSQSHESIRREENILIDRLVSRQGVSREEASFLVERHRKGERAEIDPALMEGLEEL